MDPYVAQPGDKCPTYSESCMSDINSKLSRRGLKLRKLYGQWIVVWG